MDNKSNIISLTYWRGEKKKSPPKASSTNAAYSAIDVEARVAELEARVAKLTEVLTDVVEDTSINRKTVLKLLRLLKEKN
jgi:hypothetical protein